MGLLIRYLFGQEEAILELASRRRLLVGFLLVLSAGVAREYDGGRPPWHMLLPAVASLVASYALFRLAFARIARSEGAPGRGSAYAIFLGLFWMTAPLAWFYAIPYERFLSPVGAMKANLLTLGIVSLWRVVLMMRVLNVLMGYRAFQAFFIVMAFADVVALAALLFVPLPLIDVMGGIQLSEDKQILRTVAGTVCSIGTISLPLWLIAAAVVLQRASPAWRATPPA